MKKNERKFMERDNIQNRLMYLGPGGSLIGVDFDSKSEPYIRAIDFLACLEGLPEEDEKILLEEVKKKYPNGLHSRNNMGMEWLKARLEELAADHPVTIKAVEPYGGLMIDGRNYDLYKVDIEHEMKQSVYVAMKAFQRKFVVFRPYIRYEEFGDSENIGAFYYEDVPIDSRIYKTIFFKEEIVSFREYVYEEDILKEESFGFKSKLGLLYESKFGKFAPTGGVGHLI